MKNNLHTELRESLAEIEHEQWIAWSKDIAKTEAITHARLERWKVLWRPYSELTEIEKDQDREWADKILSKLDELTPENLPNDSRKQVSIQVGMLRQWLNEDRIDDPRKMVRDEDIKTFIQLPTEELKKTDSGDASHAHPPEGTVEVNYSKL